jgi:hypothetical protein
MLPEAEMRYLQIKQIFLNYVDIISFPKLNLSGEFNFIITSGLARATRLIVIPIISSTANGSSVHKFSPFISPFSSEPSSCSPYFISNYNVVLGGLNVYQNSVSYKYENYLDEMSGRFGVDGNLQTGLCSSLISLRDYINIYGYLVTDLSRRNPEDETTPPSIQLSGRIDSLLPLDFLIYIEVSKNITVDLLSGAMIS